MRGSNKRRSGALGRLGWPLWVGLAVILLAGPVALKSPSHERDWKAEHARLPKAELAGDRVTIRNVRNFSYHSDESVRAAVYEDRTYDLARLESLWYGIARFTSIGLAHAFVSFGFEGGAYLAVSIEARQERGESWTPLRGLLRSYELIYVVGDERDIIGRRTHVRGEPVFLYRIEASRAETRAYLLTLLARVNEIHARPEFYNTLTDNCTSGLLKATGRLPLWRRLTDYRLLLPGYSDEVAYELGAISDEVPLGELRERARIRPEGVALDDPAFSLRIRGP